MFLIEHASRVYLSIWNPKTYIHTYIHQSCIAISKNPKFTNWTKHIAIKYHHFRKYVRTVSNKDGFIEVVYCSTHDQLADIFTKPTTDEMFFKLRKELMGW